ncbi:hypothetical protein V8G54_016112, partial [Vigna mungo]
WESSVCARDREREGPHCSVTTTPVDTSKVVPPTISRCDFLYYGFLCRTCGADSTLVEWVPSHTLSFPALSVSVLLPTKHHVTSDQSPITGERGMFPIIAFFLIHVCLYHPIITH